MELTHYEVLGISHNASQQEIIKAFRHMALATHPDMNNAANATVAMIRLIAAYETLSCGEKRRLYDKGLDDLEKARIIENQYLYDQALSDFRILEKEIGQEVIVEYCWQGRKMVKQEKLTKVSRFTHIELGSLLVPFIGDRAMIARITKADDKELLYVNENYHLFEQKCDVAKIKALTWGRAEAAKQDEEKKMDHERWLSEKHTLNKEVLDKKSELIEEGLNYVSPELKEDWLEWADLNSNEAYSAALVISTIKMMQELTNGTELKDIANMQYGLSGYLLEGAVWAVSYFHEKGILLKEYFEQDEPMKKLVK